MTASVWKLWALVILALGVSLGLCALVEHINPAPGGVSYYEDDATWPAPLQLPSR